MHDFAEAVSLDIPQFERAMAEHRYLERIEADVESGERSGVQGTPTFFISDVRFDGSWEQASLLAAIEQALNA